MSRSAARARWVTAGSRLRLALSRASRPAGRARDPGSPRRTRSPAHRPLHGPSLGRGISTLRLLDLFERAERDLAWPANRIELGPGDPAPARAGVFGSGDRRDTPEGGQADRSTNHKC